MSEWIRVPGYENTYEINEQGQVRTLTKFLPNRYGKLMLTEGRVQEPNKKGCLNYRGTQLPVADLYAAAFSK